MPDDNVTPGFPARRPSPVPQRFSAAQTGPHPYHEFLIDSTYLEDTGLRVLPVAGPPGTPPKVIRVHAGIRSKQVEWTAERRGDKPELPHWDTGNSADILISKEIAPCSPLLISENNHAWRVSGIYLYVSAVAPSDSDRMAAGANPADTTTPEQNWLDVSLFNRNLLRAPAQYRPGGQNVR